MSEFFLDTFKYFYKKMALTPLNNILGSNRAAHLLRRTVFGAIAETIKTFALLTPQQAIAKLFIADPATGTEWINNGVSNANSENFALQDYLLKWQIGQYLGRKASEENKLAYIFRE
jgi:hypothetical protein